MFLFQCWFWASWLDCLFSLDPNETKSLQMLSLMDIKGCAWAEWLLMTQFQCPLWGEEGEERSTWLLQFFFLFFFFARALCGCFQILLHCLNNTITKEITVLFSSLFMNKHVQSANSKTSPISMAQFVNSYEQIYYRETNLENNVLVFLLWISLSKLYIL